MFRPTCIHHQGEFKNLNKKSKKYNIIKLWRRDLVFTSMCNYTKNTQKYWKIYEDRRRIVQLMEDLNILKLLVPKVSVVTKAKWMAVTLFGQRHCRICDGKLLGVMCRDRKFIVEFVREWGSLCII
jgi:hypothetical protein